MAKRFFEDIAIALSFNEDRGFYHFLDPRTKLFYITSTVVAIIAVNSIAGLAILALINIGMATLYKDILTKLSSFIKGLAPFIVIIMGLNILLPIMFAETIDWIEILEAQAKALMRIVVLAIPILILVATTTPSDLIQGLAKMGIRYTYLYPFIVAYRFIPLIFTEMKNIYDAQRSRGLELEKGGIRQKVKSLTPILIPTTICSLLRAKDLAEALEIKGFGYSTRRSFYKSLRMGKRDYVFMAIITAAYIITAIICP
ncbi:MAG: energy-coupling factor transporter transmembrane component T [Ignisphaera sp.]